MATWAFRRQSIYLSIFIVALLLFVALPLFLIFYKTPTCFDGLKNGNEKGVDCGGKCSKICAADFLSPNVLWARALKVATGVYNVGAYIENPNLEGAASHIEYAFKLYDSKGVLITEHRGISYLPTHQNVVVFESGIQTGQRIPVRTTFEFITPVDWIKKIQPEQFLVVTSKELSNASKAPRLDAVVQNKSVKTIDAIDVVGIAYDSNDNTVGFSKSKIDSLNAGESARVVFTWPLPFEKEVARLEIIPSIRP